MDGVTLIDRSRHGFGVYHDSNRRDTPPMQTSYHSASYSARYPSSHSPPYQCGDSSKPSLPSLKTVLGETGMSPPATPPSHGISLQPLPREPLYDQSTYKPPALYPNKRTRTDSGWDARTPERTFSESAPKSLPYMSNRPDDLTRPRSQFDLPTPSNRSPVIHSHQASPDLRSQRTELPRNIHSYPSPVPRTSTYTTSEPMNAHHRSSMYSNASSVSQDDEVRRHSGFGEYQTPRERYTVEPRHQAFMPVTANTAPREEYPPVPRLDVPHGYSNAQYPYSHAFFVPSHYEYQNGKSRKRSNLPKQSTEIMKRWFDENMHNPYPSEEQKRHFAAVAGINLTQVSNWFINHRRRCPELREKRDKSRAGSRDDDM